MKRIIRVKLYENTDSDKVHLHQIVKRQDGSSFTREKALCGRYDRTEDHSEIWRDGSITNKQVLMNLLPKLAGENLEHVLCEWCIMKILEE